MDIFEDLDMAAIHAMVGARVAEVHDGIVRRTLDWWNAKTPEERAEATRMAEERQEQLAALTPAEKWARLKNPTCADDYGLSVTWEEVCAVPEAKHEVEAWLPPR